MTIRNCINAAELSQQLSNLETCADDAPEGTYEDAKRLRDFFGEVFAATQAYLADANVYGVKIVGDDRWREVEAVLYGALKACSPDATVFPVAEGFGDAVTNHGPGTRARVLQQAASNRDFLKSVGVIKGD